MTSCELDGLLLLPSTWAGLLITSGGLFNGSAEWDVRRRSVCSVLARFRGLLILTYFYCKYTYQREMSPLPLSIALYA